MIHWDKSRSHHNSKPVMAKVGCHQGILVMLLLLLCLEVLLVAVVYISWVLQVTPLKPWLTLS